MPPKAQAVEQVIQLKGLYVNFMLAVNETTLAQFQHNLETLVQPHAEYIELITSTRLKQYACDKGYIFDPDSLNEKQKKDAKFMASVQNAPQEMTPEISFKSFQGIITDVIAVKSDPKLHAAKQNQKKDTKKDTKKDAQVESEVEKKPLHNFDFAFITINFPSNQEDLNFIMENPQFMPNMILYTKQKTITKSSPNFMETLKDTKNTLQNDLQVDLNNDFNINLETEQINSKQQDKYAQIQQAINSLKQFRSQSEQSSESRNMVFFENILEIFDDENDAQNIELFSKKAIDQVIEFTIKNKDYHDFRQNVNIKKIIPHDEVQQDSELYYYKKQLQQCSEQEFGVAQYLETLLDEIDLTKNNNETGNVIVHKNDGNEIKKLFEKYEKIIRNEKIVNKKDFVKIYDHGDKIKQRVQDQTTQNHESLEFREKLLFSSIILPGINRFDMPDAVQFNLRKAKQQQIQRVISLDFDNFNHRRNLIQFEKMLKQFQPKRNWSLEQRLFSEKLTKDTLIQTLNDDFLLDPHIIQHYDEIFDKLYLALVFKNPPGRILRKQWKYQDRILPNLQYYVQKQNCSSDDQYFDEDCLKLGNISQKTKLLYPNDLGLILSQKMQFGETILQKCCIHKESYSMGIEKDNDSSKIWIKLNDMDTRLLIENNQQLTSTLTLKNGLIMKFLQNGDILQMHKKYADPLIKRNFQDIVSPYDDNQNIQNIEISRIITKHGNVIKTMKDGRKITYFTNGNIIVKQSGLFTSTNNKGVRIKKTQESLEQSENCQIKNYIDIETQSRIVIRSDKTITINYQDKSTLIKFVDNTMIYLKDDCTIVSHPNYATVKIRVDKTKERLGSIIGAGSAFAAVGKDDIMMRTFDGRVVETFLPSGCKIIGYLEKKELEGYNNYLTSYVNLFYFSDESTIKVQQGDISIIGASDRQKFDVPNEFFLQMFNMPNERKEGVYSGDLQNGLLWTKDHEGNFFCMQADGKVKSKIAVSFDMTQDGEESPEFSSDEFVETINEYLPLSQDTIEPKLFIIENDNTGQIIYQDKQLQNYFRLQKQNKNSQLIVNNIQNGLQNYQILEKMIEKNLNMIDKQIPKIIDTITETSLNQNEPQMNQFVYRNFTKYPKFDQNSKEQIEKDLSKIDNFQKIVEQRRAQNKIETIDRKLEEQEHKIQIQLYQANKK